MNIQEYLEMGFDHQMAAFFASSLEVNVQKVEANDDFSLTIIFDNGQKRLYDMKPVIAKGGVFSCLSDLSAFKRVCLDPLNMISWDINSAIDSNDPWENKIGISTESCYVYGTVI